jgi:RNA polymerase-binding transcription factor DksA
VLRGDEADFASEMEERERRCAIQRLRAASGLEEPDEDAQGNRYCLDCGEKIPAARVLAAQALRCVGLCKRAGAGIDWRREKMASGFGASRMRVVR